MKSYRDMAINLARSVEKHNPDLPFYIITDRDLSLPSDLKHTQVKIHDPKAYGVGFSVKLNLDHLAPTDKSLFIDADCLVYRDLTALFETFQGNSVGVLGVSKSDGEMFGDVASVCKACNVDSLPLFNGGLYYIEKGPESRAIYSRARELEPRYDELGLVRLRGQPNDEVLVAIALSQFGINPISNDGRFYADFQWWPQVESLDILNGIARMNNPPLPNALHQDKFPATQAQPAVVHFLGHHVESPLYLRERSALYLQQFVPFPTALARCLALPSFGLIAFKNIARPLFHKFFAPRTVQKSKSRLVISNADK